MESRNNGSLTGCENCNGYCARHKIFKHAHYVRLCQTKQAYFDAWEAGRGPGNEADPTKAKERVDAHERQIELYHALWSELHAKENPNQQWFALWVARVPNFGCGCRSWLREWLRKNPPDFDGFSRWAIGLHNEVNRKLGKPIWFAID